MPASATIRRDSNSKKRMRRGTVADGVCLGCPPCCDLSSSRCSPSPSCPRLPRRPWSTSASPPRTASTSARPTPSPASSPAPTARPSSAARSSSRSGPIPTGAGSSKVATATSGLDGRFAFERAFDRNHQVRVFAPEFGDRSAVEPVYVFPRTNLSFDLVRRNVIRVVQTYRTPTNVKLTAPTLFYVGQAGKTQAPLAARAKTRPVRPGAKPARSSRAASAPPRSCGSRGRGAGASATRAASPTTRAWATRSSAARRSATSSELRTGRENRSESADVSVGAIAQPSPWESRRSSSTTPGSWAATMTSQP